MYQNYKNFLTANFQIISDNQHSERQTHSSFHSFHPPNHLSSFQNCNLHHALNDSCDSTKTRAALQWEQRMQNVQAFSIMKGAHPLGAINKHQLCLMTFSLYVFASTTFVKPSSHHIPLPCWWIFQKVIFFASIFIHARTSVSMGECLLQSTCVCFTNVKCVILL